MDRIDWNGIITLALGVAAVVVVSIMAPDMREWVLGALAVIGLTRPRGVIKGAP